MDREVGWTDGYDISRLCTHLMFISYLTSYAHIRTNNSPVPEHLVHLPRELVDGEVFHTWQSWMEMTGKHCGATSVDSGMTRMVSMKRVMMEVGSY